MAEGTVSEACTLPEGLKLSVGVLCIQGAFREHVDVLKRLVQEKGWQFDIVDVRKPAQLADLDGLIIPGGESTTLSVFLSKNNFESALREWLFGGSPSHHTRPPGMLWGTCAGLILMANTLTEQKKGGQVTVRNSHPYSHIVMLFVSQGRGIGCRMLSEYIRPSDIQL